MDTLNVRRKTTRVIFIIYRYIYIILCTFLLKNYLFLNFIFHFLFEDIGFTSFKIIRLSQTLLGKNISEQYSFIFFLLPQ